jgi:hypothetical protein
MFYGFWTKTSPCSLECIKTVGFTRTFIDYFISHNIAKKVRVQKEEVY